MSDLSLDLREAAENWRGSSDALADLLEASADQLERQESALRSFVDTVEATGGLNSDGNPVGDPEWVDLGDAYAEACNVLQVACRVAEDGEEDEDEDEGDD